MRIDTRDIGTDSPPFVIAELSGNHGGSLDKALRIVDAVAASGAHAVKLQTYTPDTMTLDVPGGDYLIDDPASLWTGRTLYDLYREAHTPWDWHEPIFARAREHGLAAFSSPFDATAVDFLVDLDVPAFKIASLENTDHELIARAAATGKPLIISTGLATLAEIDDAVRCARGAGCEDLVLLQCTSSYPADAADSNLRTIGALRELFVCEVGLSDHTLGIGAAIASVALGARVIEKHVTLARAHGDVDAAFSLEPHELTQLVDEATTAWRALGSISFGPAPSETASLAFRRSLRVTEDLAAGASLSAGNVRALRPGGGLPPGELDKILGLTVRRDVPRGTALTWDLLR